MKKESMEESIGAFQQQSASGLGSTTRRALLHRRKRRKRHRGKSENEIRRLHRQLMKALKAALSTASKSPPHIEIRIENHFHAIVKRITQ